MVSLRTRVIVDLLFWFGLMYFVIWGASQMIQKITHPEPKTSSKSGCYLKVQLPGSIDFDQAQIILFAGGKPYIKYATSTTVPTHFDLGEECQPDEIRIRTRDGKRYRYLYPGINTTWIFPKPVHHFSYYDPDFLASLRRD